MNVFEAAKERISVVFDSFEKICVSFSAGKDSSVMSHMVLEEARKRDRKVGLLLIDLEAQYQATVAHAEQLFEEYKDVVEPYWVSLPLILSNGVSQFEPRWTCWDPSRTEAWVRQPPQLAITDSEFFPFFRVGMEFEEFVEDFGNWYAGSQDSAFFIGIRTQESLNRWRTIHSKTKTRWKNYSWTTKKGPHAYNIYPLFDWKTEDIWRANGKQGWSYNQIYDSMYRAGLSIHEARLCQPFGSDQRKGLYLFKVLEPDSWGKLVARVSGANTGALYAHKSGRMFGRIKVNLPPGHTWESFSKLLLATMPPAHRDHYENKIAIFVKWYQDRGVDPLPDATDKSTKGKGPSWERIAKVLLKQDWWCKGLSFSQTKSGSYERYMKRLKQRRKEWKL